MREKHEQQKKSWMRAMDEVRVYRLIEKWKKGGQRETDDPLLRILKNWPSSKKYKGRSELLPSLEQQVIRRVKKFQ